MAVPIVHLLSSSDIKSTLLNSLSAKSGRPSESGNDPEKPDITISSLGSHFTRRRPAFNAISLSVLILSSIACCLDMARLKFQNVYYIIYNNILFNRKVPKWTITKKKERKEIIKEILLKKNSGDKKKKHVYSFIIWNINKSQDARRIFTYCLNIWSAQVLRS